MCVKGGRGVFNKRVETKFIEMSGTSPAARKRKAEAEEEDNGPIEMDLFVPSVAAVPAATAAATEG